MYRRWYRLNVLVRKWVMIGLCGIGLVAVSQATGDPDIWRLGFVGLFFWAISDT